MPSCTIKVLLFVGMVFRLLPAMAQEKVSTVGFQLKPVFTSTLLGTGMETFSDSGFTYSVGQKTGFAAGMIIRRGYTKNLSLEFGINYCRRNIHIESEYGSEQSRSDMRIIGYEIPVSQLVFVRLSKHLYMNVSAGLCLNMFPSDVQSVNERIYAIAGRKLILNPSLLANLGFEYRTEKRGYFYMGASFNRPFSPIYDVAIDYYQNKTIVNSVVHSMNGAYLTVDFRYFFHEDPEKRKARSASSKKKTPPAKGNPTKEKP